MSTRTPTIFGMSPRNGFLLLISIALPLWIGYIGSMATMPAIPGWYADLAKPVLNPPSFIFGPVWTTLYVLMGIAAFRVFLKRSVAPVLARRSLMLYGAHLLVNLAWSFAFFGSRSPEMGVAVIGVLLLMIITLMIMFTRIDKLAGVLLVPYLLWVLFATYLNVSIALLN